MVKFFSRIKKKYNKGKNSSKTSLKDNEKLDEKSDSDKKNQINSGKDTELKNHKILICDDSYTNRLVLKKHLEKYNIDIDEAENGQRAIDMIKENGEYMIVWMDLQMPKMNGIDCTEHLRNSMDYSGTIIGLTGYVDRETTEHCLASGMDHVISKPFDVNVVFMYIDKYKDK